jgi:uncharacterized membrane protein YraQ (UPF0718 family)
MATAVIAGLLVLATLLVIRRDGAAGVRESVAASGRTLRTIFIPMALGLTMAGMAQVVLPAEVVSRWMGNDAGVLGVLVGVIVGALIPAGPYVVLPLAGSLLLAGAGVGPLAAFLTAWSLIPLSRTLTWELPFMGGALTAARFAVALPFPFVVGIVTPHVYSLFV